MPSYKYICKNCNNEIEVNSSMKNYTSTVRCENCNEQAERKIDDLLPQNYIVNCSGFYGKKS